MTEPRDRDEAARRIDDAAQDWFIRLTTGEPSREDLAAFVEWRDADPRHRAAYDEIRGLWDDADALEAAFATATPRRAVSRPGRRLALFGGMAAACAALVLAIAVDLPTRLTADYSTAVGEQRTIALPDGSTVYLNTDSAIAVDYAAGRRHIALLRGEALFEVATDPARPFDVTALDGRSRAVGTAFVVRESGEAATVTVTEGSVQVDAPLDPDGKKPRHPGTSMTLAPGDRVSYRKGAPPGPVGRVDIASATAWRNGTVAIDGLPLSEAVAEIDRYRPGRILLLADTDRLDLVTARAPLHALDGAVRALAATHGLSVFQITDYLTVIR